MQDNVNVKGKKWEFDSEVTACFDDMLERSIPGYHTMRQLVTKIGLRYAKIGTHIVDIGCSNGSAIEPFMKKLGDDCQYMAIDTSKPMLEEAKKRLGHIDIREHDITKGIPKVNASLFLSILTLQFTPIEYRQKIVQGMYDNLCSGGALIIVEKVLGNTNEIDAVMVEEYYNIKTDNAYTQEQIQDKRKSLEGVLVPITAKWNEDLLWSVGFHKIDCFYRYLNFAGWLAIK